MLAAFQAPDLVSLAKLPVNSYEIPGKTTCRSEKTVAVVTRSTTGCTACVSTTARAQSLADKDGAGTAGA